MVTDLRNLVSPSNEPSTAALALFEDEQLQTVLGNLSARWQDEREYENITDYGHVIVQTVLVRFPTVTFVKMTKRPFGFIVKADGKTFQFACTSRAYYYKRIA